MVERKYKYPEDKGSMSQESGVQVVRKQGKITYVNLEKNSFVVPSTIILEL
jgi:hypothetical protein